MRLASTQLPKIECYSIALYMSSNQLDTLQDRIPSAPAQKSIQHINQKNITTFRTVVAIVLHTYRDIKYGCSELQLYTEESIFFS